MDKRSEKILALAGGMAVVWLVADAVLAGHSHLRVLRGLLPYLTWSAALSFFVMIRLRLARRATEEQRDLALARAERADTTIFTPGEGKFEAFTIARSREQFEKWLVPLFSVGLMTALGVWAWQLWRGLGAVSNPGAQHLVAASLLAGQAFVLFLLSRYLLGLSRQGGQELLRGPGVALGVTALAAVLGTVAAVVAESATPAADRVATVVLVAVLAVIVVEGVLGFLWELYRPRRGQDLNRAYESRLGGLLADPAAWARNVAGALDYQFGFKVSETWLYRFLEGALLPLVAFQLVVLYLLSSLVFLGPEEEGIVERFGKPRATGWHLESGAHVKWPWPFETVRRLPVKRVQVVDIGYRMNPTAPGRPALEPESILWNVPHFQQEDQFLAASAEANVGTDAVPVNLVSFNVHIEYLITNVYAYAYRYAEPERAVEQLAYRTLTLTTASRGLFDVMGAGRLAMAQTLQERIQRAADQLGLGVRILFVGVAGVHPPVSVADAFQSVIGAYEDKEAAILTARAAANRVLPIASADAVRLLAEATAYGVRRTEISAAEADRFEKRLESYRLAPGVFKTRLYLSALRDSLKTARKYIIAATPNSTVMQINLEDKPSADLFDLGPGTQPHEGPKP